VWFCVLQELDRSLDRSARRSYERRVAFMLNEQPEPQLSQPPHQLLMVLLNLGKNF
jgi:hypothetical protein